MSFFDAASVDQFYFFCNGAEATDFNVCQFIGTEGISRITEFDIILSSVKYDIDINSLIGNQGLLLVHRKGEFHPFSGIITEIRYCSTTTFRSLYQVILKSPLYILTRNKNSRIFQKKSIPDIVSTLLDENGISDYLVSTKNNYPEKEYIVQFNESDFQFVSRLMEEAGLWYYTNNTPLLAEELDSSELTQPLIISDDPSCFPELPVDPEITFRTRSGLMQNDHFSENDFIYELERIQNIISRKVTVKSYNYRTPEINLVDSRDVPGGHSGLFYEYGGDFKNTSETATGAEIESKRIALRSSLIKGSSFHRGLHAGYRITIVDHDRSDMCGGFLLTEVHHEGKIRENDQEFEIPSYSNFFLALPEELISNYVPEKKTAVPTIPGVLNASVDAMGTDYATIDNVGRYRLRLPFNREKQDVLKGSKPIRMAQTYSGSAYGMHYPLHKDVEVILGHVNGDPDKPLGIASVPDANTISPVKSDNKEKSILRTAGNNSLTLDDTDGKEQMAFSAPNALSLIADGSQSISVGNDRSTSVKKNETKEVSGNQEVSIGGNFSETVKKNNDDTVTGNTEIKVTGNRIELFKNSMNYATTGNSKENYHAARCTEVKTTNNEEYQGNHSVEATGNIVHSAKGPITIKTSGDMTVKADGDLGVQGLTVMIQGNASVKLTVGGNSIELTPSGIEIGGTGDTTIHGTLMNTLSGLVLLSGVSVNIN